MHLSIPNSSNQNIMSNQTSCNLKNQIVNFRPAKGGGVAMIINNKIKFDQIATPSSINEEIIGITIKFKKSKNIDFYNLKPPLTKKLKKFVSNL